MDIKDVKYTLNNLPAEYDGKPVPDSFKKLGPKLSEIVTEELLNKPWDLLNKLAMGNGTFFHGEYGVDCLRQYTDFIDYLPKLAKMILPVDYWEQAEEWGESEKGAKPWIKSYELWYRREVKKENIPSYTVDTSTMSAAGGSIVAEEAERTKDRLKREGL